MSAQKKWNTVGLKDANDTGIINLSDGQIKKAEKAGGKFLSYSLWAGEGSPVILDDCNQELFYIDDNNRLIALPL